MLPRVAKVNISIHFSPRREQTPFPNNRQLRSDNHNKLQPEEKLTE